MSDKAMRNGNVEVEWNPANDDIVPNGPLAAEKCGLARSTLNTYRALERGPAYYRYKNRIYYLRGELESWKARMAGNNRGRRRVAQAA